MSAKSKSHIIRNFLLGVATLVVLFLLVVAARPGEFRVERSAAIAAPPEVLFAQFNSHRKFNVWNPFMKLDPHVRNSYSGPDSGVGAVCSWEGNSDIGAGSCTIIESQPGELVRCRMDWKRPMEGTSTVDFTFKPQGDRTVVTWAMYGTHNFVGKLVSVFLDCDKICGPQFEKGLAELGSVVAAPASRNGS